MERREFLGVGAAAAAGLVTEPWQTVAGTFDRDDVSREYRQAIHLLEQVPLIDGHNDVAWQYRVRVGNRLNEIDLAEDTSGLDPPLHTDMPRLREGRLGGQFWSVYVPTDITGAEAAKAQLEQLDMAHRMIARYDELEYVTTADGAEEAFANGRIGSFLGMEGGHVLDNSLATLRMFYEAGARYLTLTHGEAHDWADSATDEPRHGGITDFGREVVREMNWLGMLVDLSHVHPKGMHDVLDVTESPVLFTHSSAMGVTENDRNVPDDVLDRVPDNDGVVMVTFVPGFVTDQPTASVSDVADHIDYIRDRIGAKYIGIGADYDGISTVPEGLEDVSTYPNLFAELIRRGYSRRELKQIAGMNALRAIRDNEDVSARLRSEREASDAKFEDFGDVPAEDRMRTDFDLYEEDAAGAT
ncbi:MAG TPA: dipeptidase [Jiangellaceae bacterium]|nr:dipeptidase [Jiangellaceae bacterium]